MQCGFMHTDKHGLLGLSVPAVGGLHSSHLKQCCSSVCVKRVRVSNGKHLWRGEEAHGQKFQRAVELVDQNPLAHEVWKGGSVRNLVTVLSHFLHRKHSKGAQLLLNLCQAIKGCAR